jgi:hypothetical protein
MDDVERVAQELSKAFDLRQITIVGLLGDLKVPVLARPWAELPADAQDAWRSVARRAIAMGARP